MSEAMPRRVLVLGATSYVAQFVLQRLMRDEAAVVACSVRSVPDPLPAGFVLADARKEEDHLDDSSDVTVFPGVDLADMASLEACISAFRPDLVINCIALSSPAACEKNPTLASTINEPYAFVDFLRQLPWRIHLLHFSTDFVYRGDQSPGSAYDEEAAALDDDAPRSVYATTKLRFDTYLQSHPLPGGCTVLRIANVLGQRAPVFRGVESPKFMEWLHLQLFAPSTRDQSPVKLWSDEYRSFIYVEDLAAIVDALQADLQLEPVTRLVNVGGVEALTRVEVAQQYVVACAAERERTGASPATCREIEPTARALVKLGHHSPLDARLNTSRLEKLLPSVHRTPTASFLDAIARELLVDDSKPAEQS